MAIVQGSTQCCAELYWPLKNSAGMSLVFATDLKGFFRLAITLFSIAKVLRESWRSVARSSVPQTAVISWRRPARAIALLCLHK